LLNARIVRIVLDGIEKPYQATVPFKGTYTGIEYFPFFKETKTYGPKGLLHEIFKNIAIWVFEC
jgi:hypothetical protein